MKAEIMLLTIACCLILSGCNNTPISDGRNFFGGEGSFRYEDSSSHVWEDDRNIYFYGLPNYTGFNTVTKSFAVACPVPGCSHNDSGCRTYDKRFVAFKGDLIMLENEKTNQADGTVYEKGYLYRCYADSREKVFENVLPDALDENIKKGRDEKLDYAVECGEYLVLHTGVYSYLLDGDFNIRCTIFDMGSAPRVFYVNNEYYYIDKLYRLIKLNTETGEGEPVNLDGMKITEGETDGHSIWFSNDRKELCSFEPKTGEIKKHAENAIMIQLAGNYVMYSEYGTGSSLAMNVSDGSVINICGENYYCGSLAYWDGRYYLSCRTLNDYAECIIELDENMDIVAEYMLED